jgi:hypothetical protein
VLAAGMTMLILNIPKAIRQRVTPSDRVTVTPVVSPRGGMLSIALGF